ncbi:MAG TPA: AAA family ATPase [Thermoanaerobaculia bacterium]|jgi:Holliday junction resolvasome RuvABC ATP-dependent DNA helicase subunit|nr:AAA family ATPase [Thermoanaerobaculia bacterium]
MTRQQLVAQALVSWLGQTLPHATDAAREALPLVDVEYFFHELAVLQDFHSDQFSIALAGFGIGETRLRELAEAAGLQLRAVTDDLHVAAAWRNARGNNPHILAFARGFHPGVSTLRHFDEPRSHDLALALLEWAKDGSRFCANAAQRSLLEALSSGPFNELLSLESTSRFLAAWSIYQTRDANSAPSLALPHLGLIADPDLLAQADGIEARVAKNRDVTRQVIDASSHHIRGLRGAVKRRLRKDVLTRERLLDIIGRIEKLRLQPTFDRLSAVTVEEVGEAWRPPVDLPDATPPDEDEQEERDDYVTERPESVDLQEIASFAGDALLDNRQDRLERMLEDLEQNLADALNNTEGEPSGEVRIGDATYDLDLKVDREFLNWLHAFCTEEVWGGVVESEYVELPKALIHYAGTKHHFTEPAKIVTIDGQSLALERLLEDWDRDLARRGHTTNLSQLWRDFVGLRKLILPNLDLLVHFPLNWLAGRVAMAEVLTRYLDTSARLYRQVQQYYRDISDVDVGWARAVLDGLLALDIVQVRTKLDDERWSFKALLLPTHPLHLWRYQRLVAVLRGLGSSLAKEDRKAVLDECRRPEQFLSVLFASSLPAGRGGGRLLPISSDLHGLATFENLQNAYAGLDGLDAIRYTLDRFAVTSRNHTMPLRVAIVNPPQATTLVAALIKLLSRRRASTVRTLRVELFATNAPSVKARAARALEFSGKEQEVIEDRLTGGRLELQVHEKPRPMNELVADFAERPFHLVIVFDEAGVAILRHGMPFRLLPMSPFCLRKTIRYEEHRNMLRLVPSNDDAPFTDFMQLVNEAESGQRDSTPQTWADAENLRQVIDDILQGEKPGAAWLLFADRALPHESGLRSVRLLMRREGQRDVLVLTRDYRRLAHRVRPAFAESNLQFSSTQLDNLLEEGVNLVGAGLLDLIKHDGSPDINRVRGLAGMLLAARDYRRRYPESLIVSVDDAIARLWLRLGKRGERCDLLCLRREEEKFVLDALEVKTTAAEAGGGSENALIRDAQVQIAATLEAVAQGLPSDNNEGPLSAPRCEMLKEVFVRGCLSRSVPAYLRSRWSQWLKDLFRQEDEATPYELRGEVVRIAIRNTQASTVREIVSQPYPITLRQLNDTDVQKLVDAVDTRSGDGVPQPSEAPTMRLPTTASPLHQQSEDSTDAVLPPHSLAPPIELAESPNHSVASSTVATDDQIDYPWPPRVNEFGMIGQVEVVRQLLNQIHFAHDFGERFSDKLFVGTAGVGKSSLARAIADRLISEPPIQFNGADLQKPKMFIERLQQSKKVPLRPRGRVRIEACVIFIDEVHAINGAMVTALLGALDDARLTTIDNIEYDFSQVVLLMATTDPGRLPEAFRSRPGRVLLRNYTLEEMAGILWKHGRDVLEGFELPREVCLEISARLRCRPREAVRMLSENLIQHFHGLARREGRQPSRRLIGEMMTVESVAAFFDDQGIDSNGVDQIGRNYLLYLHRNGATAEERLRQALGIPNRNDFIEVDEYLQRLGLVTIQGGRTLTTQGRRYVQAGPIDLRTRIARQIG